MISPRLDPTMRSSGVLPEEVQRYVDSFLNQVVEIEKEGYASKLVPFSQKQKEMKASAKEYFSSLHQKLKIAQKVLKEQFEIQELMQKKVNPEASFSLWEKAKKKLEAELQDPQFSYLAIEKTKPLQEQLEIPWAFMRRAYETASQLLEQKRYEEAECIYIFLCFLHPQVFEFWFCSAACKKELGKLEDALDTYALSLLWDPCNPLVFFQIAGCYMQGKEQEGCKKALDMCIHYAEGHEEYRQVLQDASRIKAALAV